MGDAGVWGRGSGVGLTTSGIRDLASPTRGGGWPDSRPPTPDPRRSHHLPKTRRIHFRRRLAGVRHKRIRRQERERVFSGRITTKFTDCGSSEPRKDLGGVAGVVVVSEYLLQSRSQSVGNAPKPL